MSKDTTRVVEAEGPARRVAAVKAVVVFCGVGVIAGAAMAAEVPRVHPVKTISVPPWEPPLETTSRGEVHVFVPVEPPTHSFLPPEIVARMREAVAWDPNLAAGREIEDAAGGKLQPRAAVPKVRISFDGLDRATAANGGFRFFPPDPTLGASPGRILEAGNEAMRLSDRQGHELALRPMGDFFASPYPPGLFDPKVYFDEDVGRFFVVTVSQDEDRRKAYLFLGVSRGPSPSSLSGADWCTYRIRGKRRGTWPDYPDLGANDRWLVATVNGFRFGNDRFKMVFAYVMDKVGLADNAAGCPVLELAVLKIRKDVEGFPAFTVRPARHFDRTGPDNPFLLLSTRWSNGSDDYLVWRIEGDRLEDLSLSHVDLDLGLPYALPPNASQAGGAAIDTGDMRMMQATFRDGLLWGVHATGCLIGELPNESCIRVVSLRIDDDGATVELADTFGRSGWSFFWPGLAVNRRGDANVVFLRAGEGRQLGTGYSGKKASAALFRHVKSLEVGRCPIDNFSEEREENRSGDYVGVQVDPADELSFWVAGEYAAQVEGLDCDWRTRIARVSF